MVRLPPLNGFGTPTLGASQASEVRSPLPDWRDFKRLEAQRELQKGS